MSCPPMEFARQIAGEKFTSPEHMMKLAQGVEKVHLKFDMFGDKGD